MVRRKASRRSRSLLQPTSGTRNAHDAFAPIDATSPIDAPAPRDVAATRHVRRVRAATVLQRAVRVSGILDGGFVLL